MTIKAFSIKFIQCRIYRAHRAIYHRTKQLPKIDSNGVFILLTYCMIAQNEHHYMYIKTKKFQLIPECVRKTKTFSNGLYAIWWTTIICTVSMASKVVPFLAVCRWSRYFPFSPQPLFSFVSETRFIGSN